MAPDTISGKIRWSGEHWINYIRRPGEETDSGSVSLYVTRYGEAGEGIVAYVTIPQLGFDAVCTNNHAVAAWIHDMMVKGRGNQFDRPMPVLDATFTQGGDIRKNPSWTIDVDGHTIVSTWNDPGPEVIHYGPAPVGTDRLHIFSLLFFTSNTVLTFDGKRIDGQPYTREIWRKSIGGGRSSCVFALAETTMWMDPK